MYSRNQENNTSKYPDIIARIPKVGTLIDNEDHQYVSFIWALSCNILSINPLRSNSDMSQTSHCNIKGLSVREVMRIENMITQVKFF